jgi:hypothetical protein
LLRAEGRTAGGASGTGTGTSTVDKQPPTDVHVYSISIILQSLPPLILLFVAWLLQQCRETNRFNPIEMALRTLTRTKAPRLEKSKYDIAEEAFKSWIALDENWLKYLTNIQKMVLTDEEKKRESRHFEVVVSTRPEPAQPG